MTPTNAWANGPQPKLHCEFNRDKQTFLFHSSKPPTLHGKPSANLPSSASLKSVQTWSASATQAHHTRGLSSASSAKRENFGRCARASGFDCASGISTGKLSDVGSWVINSSEIWEVGVNELQRRRVNKPESDVRGVCETDPPERTGVEIRSAR